MRRLREPRSHHRAEAMQITHARTNDSLRRSRVRRASLLGWLPVAAAVALSGCTVKKTEAPAITGPSELGLSLELTRVAGRPQHGRRLAVDADHHLARLERQDPAERRHPRRGRGRRRDRRRPRPPVDQERQDGWRRPRVADLYGAEQRVQPEQRQRQHHRDVAGHPGRLRLPQRGRSRRPDPAGAAGRPAAAAVFAGGAVHDVADHPR